jgi:hypothetical protein
MKTDKLLRLEDLCVHYEVEHTFFMHLSEAGLIEITIINNTHYIHPDRINDVEKMMRLHHDLELNIEGIDVVFHLLQKIDCLNTELVSVRNRLLLYEEDND